MSKNEVRGPENDLPVITITEEFSGFMNCPVCSTGVLWGVRNIKTDQILDEVDTCASCGSRFKYLNIKNTKIRKRRNFPSLQLHHIMSS